MVKTLLFPLFILLFAAGLRIPVSANHIVGGELKMRPLNASNLYEITLVQFWDSNNLIIPGPNVSGNRDVNAELFIFRKKDNVLMDRLTVEYVSTTDMQYQNKACATYRSLETSIGTYRGNFALNAGKYNDPAGYYIVWERCCRNDDINNIVAPGENGMVFYLEFPPLTTRNASPRFLSPNGQYICNNRPFSMNMSATDADGDELRYSLVTPMRGHTDQINIYGDDTPKSSFPLVSWSAGISDANMIPGSSPLAISNSGILSVNASHVGLYVFAIQCDEYRAGKKIGQVRRDFQLLVIDCNDDQPEPPVIMMGSQPVRNVAFCPEKTIELETAASDKWSYQWQLNGQNIPGATTATIAVQDTGLYSVVKSYTEKCSRDTSSENVHVSYASVPAEITMNRDTICEGETVTLLANGGNVGKLALSWIADGKSLSEKSAGLDVSSSGTFILNLKDNDTGCTGSDTARIVQEKLQVNLPLSQTVIRGSQIDIEARVVPAGNAYVYHWTPPAGVVTGQDGKVVTVAPDQETVYTVQVASPAGCIADTSTIVKVIDKMHIPTAFTPDGDGVNDKFEIFNGDGQILDVRIYNRWGELVYQSPGYSTPWDGTYKSKLVASGAYPYIIKTPSGNVNGTITIIR
ncbi:gliding motility-associated C-terminal domain-containing protein [Dyadobacter sandarakinus]|uniref:Gliding motility-associated C-terminal domain-containing protein n=1 Tax=Dyadobacter sandarakinus TaxID=2747268 RepID=A0ABX7I2Z0_9BACT|nr:gliding motility-associated C-terminal domain-containing protein [Dyadobacter sandarakinus]QRR00452.1 gliding motility-associated C-terminal domain-containing protein [Dyadobacter sandarakinus]